MDLLMVWTDLTLSFNPIANLKHRPQITREVKLNLYRLLETPGRFMEHFR